MTLDLGETRDWFASRVIQVAALVAAAVGIAFFLQGARRADNIIDLSLFRDRSFTAANGAMLGFGLAMFGTIAVLPIFVQSLLGYGVLDAGYLFMPRGLAAETSMVLTGAVLLRRFDARILVAAGLLLTGTGNLSLGRLDLDAGFWDLARPDVISGLGVGLFFVPMSTVAFQNIGPDRQDESSGIYGLFCSLGSSVGIALVGWQLATRTQVHWAVLSGAITPFGAAARAYLAPLGLAPDTAEGAAALAGPLAAQAQMLAFADAFTLTGWGAYAMLPAILFMTRPRPGASAAPAGH